MLIAGVLVFLFARNAYWEIVLVMILQGLGIGCVFAFNPAQIVAGVPEHETGSAMSFYQTVRTIGYAVASALSATALMLYVPAGQPQPAAAGYDMAALISLGVLGAGLVASIVFAVLSRRT